MSTRQTLKDYLSERGFSGASGISYTSEIAPGDPAALDEGDDLGRDPNTGAELVGFGSPGGIIPGYVGYITQRAGNAFPIDSAGPAEQSQSAIRGVGLAAAEDQGAVDVFTPTNEYPQNPSYFDSSGYAVTSIVNKTGEINPVAKTGDALLSETVSSDMGSDTAMGQTRAVKSTFAMLKKYNKYVDAAGTQDKEFAPESTASGAVTAQNLDDIVRLNFQKGDGVYTLPESSDSTQVSLTDLHSVAHSMLLKAAGWDDTTDASTSPDPDTLLTDPSVIQSYPTIVSSLYPDQVRARDAYGAPKSAGGSFLAGAGEAVPRSGDESVYNRATTNAYTPGVTFTSADQKNQFALYQAAISMVGLAKLVQESFASLKSYTKDETLVTNGLGPFHMGQTTRSKATATLRAVFDVVLTNTGRWSYEDAVRAGVTLYFGIDLDDPKLDPIALNNQNNDRVKRRLAQSYGFWHSVSRACVKLISLTSLPRVETDQAYYANVITDLLNSKAIRITNVFAQIGYTYLAAHLATPDDSMKNEDSHLENSKLRTAFDVDSFETLPGTRVMKSRDSNGRSALSLAWRHSAVPSALLLPPSLIQATLDMDYIMQGPNPVKQMAGTTLQDKTYVPVRQNGRIPIEVVNNLENRLDAEYVPFYFHDLRTNEIVGLHAFLETLSDNYNASYNSTQFHGRADTVKNYTSTKRSISFSFWVASTSEEDFDEMWAKINKLITLVYPQYTQGTLNSSRNVTFNTLFGKPTDFRFEQPFSQIVGATPVIRLRIGDVIKSNYSRFNLARIFGAGNPEAGGFATSGLQQFFTDVKNSSSTSSKNLISNTLMLPLLAVIGSPAEVLAVDSIQQGYGAIAKSIASDLIDASLKNGFVNPLLPGLLSVKNFTNNDLANNFFDLSTGGKFYLKPRNEPYVFTKGKRKAFIKLTRPIEIKVKNSITNPTQSQTSGGSNMQVAVTIPDFSFALIPNSFKRGDIDIMDTATCEVTLDQCLLDPDTYFSTTLMSLMLVAQASITSGLTQVIAQGLSAGSQAFLAPHGVTLSTNLFSDLFGSYMRQYTAPLANPITYAMEDSMSRGLAGVITSIQFNWLEGIPWETNWNSRAPTACKITMAFDPIHDIAPGLDSYGANRAPVYNVGNTRLVAGDPLADNGVKSKYYFDKQGKEAAWLDSGTKWVAAKFNGVSK